MMLDMYSRQQLRAVWRGCRSINFETSNWIRQGGVISPLLFCVYIDMLLIELEKAGTGCHKGRYFYGALCYADDITLCAPSIDGLRCMLRKCETFGDLFSVTYNPTKTVCVQFSRSRITDRPSVYLNGSQRQWREEVNHLGNHLTYNLREHVEICEKKSDLIQRVNSVIVTLGRSSSSIICKVFNSQCAHFYGAEAWSYADKTVSEFQTMWNRCVRRLFHLPHMTHRHFLPQLLNCPTALNQIYVHFLKMLVQMEKSDNKRVSFLARIETAEASLAAIYL